MTALWYGGRGTARLAHKGNALAKGGVRGAEDGGEDAMGFNVLLHGTQRDDARPGRWRRRSAAPRAP